jgi:hypothetical protein
MLTYSSYISFGLQVSFCTQVPALFSICPYGQTQSVPFQPGTLPPVHGLMHVQSFCRTSPLAHACNYCSGLHRGWHAHVWNTHSNASVPASFVAFLAAAIVRIASADQEFVRSAAKGAGCRFFASPISFDIRRLADAAGAIVLVLDVRPCTLGTWLRDCVTAFQSNSEGECIREHHSLGMHLPLHLVYPLSHGKTGGLRFGGLQLHYGGDPIGLSPTVTYTYYASMYVREERES